MTAPPPLDESRATGNGQALVPPLGQAAAPANGAVRPPPGSGAPAVPAGELDLVVGRPPSHHLHLFALLVAGVADLAAFFGVISTIVDDDAVTIWCVVLGMTAMAVMLSHFAGVAFRDALDGHLPGGRFLGSVALVAWLGLGLGATWVRWRAGASDAGADEGLRSLVGPTALMLLALYVATGVVATVGAYVTHNRMLSALVRARRRRRRLAARRTALKADHAHAEAVLAQRELEHERDDWRWLRAREGYHAYTDRLRHSASLLMAQRMQEPAATDGLTRARDREVPKPPAEPRVPAVSDLVDGIRSRGKPPGPDEQPGPDKEESR